MCPSYRATRDEKHLTRGRANTLRLAISGQLGPDAFTSPEMKETLDLCVSCKGCKRDCPTGVDMARMKIEFLHHYHKRHGLPLKERLIAWLPRYAPYAAKLAPLMNLRDRIPVLARLSETLARLQRAAFAAGLAQALAQAGRPRRRPTSRRRARHRALRRHLQPLLRAREPRGGRAGARGWRLPHAQGRAAGRRRPLCCGRTFLSAGLVDEARSEARRTLDALAPYVAKGARIVGLEPSCMLTFRDEFTAILPKAEVAAVPGRRSCSRNCSRPTSGRAESPARGPGGPRRASARPLPPEGL